RRGAAQGHPEGAAPARIWPNRSPARARSACGAGLPFGSAFLARRRRAFPPLGWRNRPSCPWRRELMKHFTLAAAFALLAQPVLAEDKVTLILDWFVNPDHAPIIVAQEKGFFADEGLEVEVVAPADPADPPKLVAAGRADYAISYQPQLHLQVHEGLPLKRIGTLVATPLNCLMVKADGPVQDIADLKGRKIGYSVSGVEEALVGRILDTAGLTMDDVEMVNVNWSLAPALI